MNQWIAQKDKWTLTELQERNDYLMGRALEIWRLPETAYKPVEKQMDTVTLDDDVNLTGRMLVRFSYRGIEQPVTSWVEMYESVMKSLHTENKSVLYNLAHTHNDNDISVHVSTEKTALRGTIEIEDGLYIERNTSTWLKISLLRRFFELYNANPSDLVFYLKDTTDDEKLEGRHELRKRYWTYALPIIQNAHSDSQCFSRVHPTKYNWIGGTFGIGGCSIYCTANYDCVNVGLKIGTSDENWNKTIFDEMYAHKAEIEKQIGCEIGWDHFDGHKAAYVFLYSYNMGIQNESDWERMATFHAEWSKKFYDVLVPYLAE